ncbi:uncharacterized protein BO96DRAFT_423376 [Aspergillus niger CBS 101883]|uniref:uncharacterized protein n=1 Tax=Aspergillus lacticoffeatus (strain CBS 101883) TaxID=1450533 RepID=UPI000D7F0116|nr:uncharacterized protein BO96DRAFT_423376 [Aspergillus niger CBS 101883]PYH56071.1 hypothetical protein BO96DRAFT_423376 [Aspergillus niger CBS 101883]
MYLKAENRQRSDTPASSVEPGKRDIDPRLLKANSISITKTSPCHLNTQLPHPSSTEVPIRRSVRGTAKATDLAPVRESKSRPQTVKRLTKRCRRAQEQLCERTRNWI